MSGPTVVYVGGMARSGTSVLGMLLASAPGVVWAGELRHLGRDLRDDRWCTCGAPASACPWWSVVRRRWSGAVGADVRALAEVSGARVVVDTSKTAGRARALLATDLRVRLVWALREPARLAGRHARRPTGVEQVGASPLGLAARDLASTVAWRRLAARVPVVRVDHDALMADPDALRDLCGALQLPAAPVLAARAGPLSAEHVLTANRLRHGPVVPRTEPAPTLSRRWRLTAAWMRAARRVVG